MYRHAAQMFGKAYDSFLCMESRESRVFVCDPHPFTLEGIERAFTRAGLNVVGATTDPAPCLTERDRDGSVIYFVDYTPGGAFGARLIAGLISADRTRRVVASSAHDHLPLIASAYEAGANAFVTKRVPAAEVIEVILAVDSLPGALDRHFPGNLGNALATYYVDSGRADASPRRLLTNRQLAIFRLIAEGYEVSEVADRLQLNPRTVGNHMVAIRRRLNITRSQFRACAVKHRLIDPMKVPSRSRANSPAPRAEP